MHVIFVCFLLQNLKDDLYTNEIFDCVDGSMIMVSANESFKKILNPSGEMNVSAYVASGAAAGALVSFLLRGISLGTGAIVWPTAACIVCYY